MTTGPDATMSIFPLPQFEADADPAEREMTDEERYARLESPSTIVVRVGSMRRVAEYPYKGDAKPGCGSKLVAKTHRGLELVEMLTTTCPNAGCGKSVTRSEMLDYIKASGGKDYPFRTDGRILRVATIEDLNEWSAIQSTTLEKVKVVKRLVAHHGLEMNVVDVEPILGQEQMTVYYMSEDRVDFRELVKDLAAEFETRIEMRQVGGRDEARLTADYEKCGQHCCCQNFLKVLKPISMRAAKTQKATLDPLKISGRCGRLMCCLRYEDETYTDLKKRLPHRKTRVGTPEGPGIVLDSKILVQLVLVKLEEDGREIAVPVEELCDPDDCPVKAPEPDPLRGLGATTVEEKTDDRKRKRRRRRSKSERQAEHR
ncbi:MAG: regulatory iron-sulfur-containing complex subunit RicT, partial [Planctomycetota bacterium]|nr:regulatory iron-sulfur-containing complex subunit RicT [Planctomycetota bacterium]